MKVEMTVKKETTYIAAWAAILSLLMQAIFILLKKWDYTVLLGNLWGGTIAVANFFVMGLFVQKAVTQTEDEARKTIKLSYSLRNVALLVLVILGVVAPFFSTGAVLIPLFFPSIAVYLKAFKPKKGKEANQKNE